MTDQTLLNKIHALPKNIQSEILDFVEFLTQKYRPKKKEKVIPQFGSLKGTFKMSEDFDAPLDEFKDYM